MLTRRIATFILGAWLGCALLMGTLVLSATGSAAESLQDIGVGGDVIVEQIGPAAAEDLMQYQSWEQLRRQWRTWEEAQFLLAGFLVVCFLFSSNGRIVSLLLTGAMVAVLIFQYFGVFADLQQRSRTADFAEAGSSAPSDAVSLVEFYGGLEAVKILLGGVLASYLFAQTTSSRKSRGSRGHRRRKRVSEESYPLET